MKKKLLFLIPAFVGMSVFTQAQQKVGVKTNDPQATLDINGNMSIEKVESVNDNVQALGWDKDSRQVRIITPPSKLFYTLDYRIECANADRKTQNLQWVSDFDTGIPADKYNVFFGRVLPVSSRYYYWDRIDIRHAGFDRDEVSWSDIIIKAIDVHSPNPNKTRDGYLESGLARKDRQKINPVLRKEMWIASPWNDRDGSKGLPKTWHISLGYVDARPDDTSKQITYEWNVRIMAVVKDLSSIRDVEQEGILDNSITNPSGEFMDNPLNPGDPNIPRKQKTNH